MVSMQSQTITSNDVAKIAELANIPITPDEEQKLADGFTTTMKVVEELKQANTDDVEPTHQVTGLTNITREDVVDDERMFSQDEALRNAPHTYNGFFVVGQVIDKNE